MSSYLFDQSWEAERKRLDALSSLYDGGTCERLARVGVAKGWRCLEVGAGSGTIASWMARTVGPEGHVVALDRDTRFLDPQLYEVCEQDLATGDLGEQRYDLIHARAVLQHVPQRVQVVERLVAALRPQGWLVLEDIVEPHPVSFPVIEAWGKFLRAITAGLARTGADPSYGIRLESELAATRLQRRDSDARVVLVHTGTPSVEFVALSLAHVAPQLIQAGAMTAAEVDALELAFRTPGHTMTAAIMICAWGQKP